MANHPRRLPRTKTNPDEPVRIHIQNSPPAPDGLTLDKKRLSEALSSRKALRGREFEISIDDGAEQLPADLDAEIIITLAKIDVAKAREAATKLGADHLRGG